MEPKDRSQPHEPERRRAAGLLSAALSAALGSWLMLAGSTAALGLGDIVQQSALGEPFRATIALAANAEDLAGPALAPECFRLVAGSERRSGLPAIVLGRAALARHAQGVYIVVTSDAVTREPALSFTVEAGCKIGLRRQYTVLLDPPAIRDAIVATTAVQAALPARDERTVAGPATSGVRAAARTPFASRRAPRMASGGPRTAGQRPAIAAALVESERIVPAPTVAVPRLRVSRSTDEGFTAHGARAKSDQEARREIEAETIVLQRRIAELSGTLARLDGDLRRATAARDAAERAARASVPQAREARSRNPFLALAAIVLALALLVVRARRAPSLSSLGVTGLAASTLGHTSTDLLAEAPRDDAPPVRAERLPTPPAPANDSGPRVPGPSLALSDEEETFDDDLIRYAEQRSEYSALEREHPRIVASVVRDWGRPKVIAYLRDLLVSPRKASGKFSREAVSDLMFLQGLAMERAGYRPQDHPWRIDLEPRRRRAG